ncbi:MAG: ABC transporter permease [Kiritimatiellae bacterium]|nr:ABC transporter permease [Kiritimatiellia bacterium]MCO5062212.1 ABC transporter permease [Kiritimatiellia bacterium]
MNRGMQLFRRRPLALISFAIVLLYALIALYGESVYRWHQWTDTTPAYQNQDIEQQYEPPSARHWMGTDGLGRDVFLRVVQGTRIAFHVGVITSCIAIPIGVLLGLIAGYFGGRIDDAVVWLYSTFAAIPGLLFILAIAMVAGKGLTGVFLGIGLTTWVGICRLIRAETMKHRDRAYVQAARVLGYSAPRILFRHILPNVFHIVIVTFTLRFPAAVGTEVFMSFLGIGVQGEPSWGLMLNSARGRLWQGVWWEMTFVTLAVFLLVLAFNILGDQLRDALDPRSQDSSDRSLA